MWRLCDGLLPAYLTLGWLHNTLLIYISSSLNNKKEPALNAVMGRRLNLGGC